MWRSQITFSKVAKSPANDTKKCNDTFCKKCRFDKICMFYVTYGTLCTSDFKKCRFNPNVSNYEEITSFYSCTNDTFQEYNAFCKKCICTFLCHFQGILHVSTYLGMNDTFWTFTYNMYHILRRICIIWSNVTFSKKCNCTFFMSFTGDFATFDTFYCDRHIHQIQLFAKVTFKKIDDFPFSWNAIPFFYSYLD